MSQSLMSLDLTRSDVEELASRLAALPAPGLAHVKEFLATLDDLSAAGLPEPSLRQAVQRLFARSVQEFFTIKRRSMQLPESLLPLFRAEEGAAIALPEDDDDRAACLDEVLRSRRSVRNFSSQPLTLTELGTVLRRAAGCVGHEDGYGVRALPLFPYPSMGGLSSLEVAVVAHRIENLDPGYYRFDQVGMQLVSRIRGDMRLAVQDVTYETEWLMYAPAVIVLAQKAEKFDWKYHTRGYRMSHLEIGAAMQNIYLSAWASQLGVCALAGFLDDEANKLFHYDGVDTCVTLMLAIGHPSIPLGVEAVQQ